MAERYAVATGNWSAVGTWDGGAALPTTGDDVHANTYTVTIDQDVTVGTLRTTAGATAAAGGTFAVSGARTITADTYAGTSTCLSLTASGQVLIGNPHGSSTSSGVTGVTVFGPGSVIGNVFGGSQGKGAYFNNGGTLTGNSTGGSGSAKYGVYLSVAGVQNGNSTGGTSANAFGTFMAAGAIQNGNSTGTAGSGYNGTSAKTGSVQNGNSTGGSVSGSYGTNLASGAIQNGAATGGSASGAHGTNCENYSKAFAKITVATGNTAGAFGVNATGTNYAIVVIDSESGSYPKSLAATVDTTTTNMPLFAASGGGGLLEPGSMNGGMV